MIYQKSRCFDEFKSTLREVVQLTEAGVRPRGSRSQHFTATQIDVGITMGTQATMAKAMSLLGLYELAWRLPTNRASMARQNRITHLLALRRRKKQAAERRAAMTPEQLAAVEKYESLHGRARKRYRRRHRDLLPLL